MKHVHRRAFTLIELLVVIAIIALLMAILMPALNRAREQGKRGVCLSHLKQLQLSWIMYCNENDQKMVNGDTEEYGIDKNRPAWVKKDWAANTTMLQKKIAIETGALFPYCSNIKSYHCPTGSINKTELRMYAIVDSMSCRGWSMDGATMLKKTTEVKTPQNRMVFIDDGGTGGSCLGGWTVYSDQYKWWDPPPIRHGNGTTFSYVDGHADYFKWKDSRTTKFGEKETAFSEIQTGNPDLKDTAIGVWGSHVSKNFRAN